MMWSIHREKQTSSINVVIYLVVLINMLVTTAESTCTPEQVEWCRQSARDDGGGVNECIPRTYVHYTHVCSPRPDGPSYGACCCRLPTATLLCCRHRFDAASYLCDDREETVDRRDTGVMTRKVVIAVGSVISVIVLVAIIVVMTLCYRRHRVTKMTSSSESALCCCCSGGRSRSSSTSSSTLSRRMSPTAHARYDDDDSHNRTELLYDVRAPPAALTSSSHGSPCSGLADADCLVMDLPPRVTVLPSAPPAAVAEHDHVTPPPSCQHCQHCHCWREPPPSYSDSQHQHTFSDVTTSADLHTN